MAGNIERIRWFDDLRNSDVALVGGKNASLGEMIHALADAGIRVPPGFATTADAYREFVAANGLDRQVSDRLEAYRAGRMTLQAAGEAIRRAFLRAALPDETVAAITDAYRELSRRCGRDRVDVAVRSSATAEDLPDASFAGQQESYLNVCGEADLLAACRKCMASLFTERAIAYRDAQGFDHLKVALSVGVQKMVRADQAGAGVMFTLDTDSGFPEVVLINAGWGLGETVVKGTVDPDEYMVFKPLLAKPGAVPIIEKRLGGKALKMIYGTQGASTREIATQRIERDRFVLDEAEILQLARWAMRIEAHYGMPMDIEWGKDGETAALYVLQARPETVQFRRGDDILKTYRIEKKGNLLVSGVSVGDAIATGVVCRLQSPAEIERLPDNAVLVTSTTNPDWVPIMKRAAAIVTDHGGRTSHAAIVSRELGLPAVIGTDNATTLLPSGLEVTVSCAEGDVGHVYEGWAEYAVEQVTLADIPETKTGVMLNMADPAAALRWWRLPSDGVGLARLEFIIGNLIGVHPLALTRFDRLQDRLAQRRIESLTRGWKDKAAFFVDRLARGIAMIAAVQYPRPVIVRMSDFKTNEYAGLIGGREFEPEEENPMIGFRGASRYYSDRYREGFALECMAIRRIRDQFGLDNVVVMIPFCRTPEEADRVLSVMAENGLERGRNGLEVYVMCELPSNVILAAEFAERFDGFSIGSNDLTQLVLGIDRDSALLASMFDERNPAVISMIRQVVATAHRHGCKVGLCGQAPSDHPDFVDLLVRAGIDSLSVTPDSFVAVKRQVYRSESGLKSA